MNKVIMVSILGIFILFTFTGCEDPYPDVAEWEGYTWHFTKTWRVLENNYLEAVDSSSGSGGIYYAQIRDPEFDDLSIEVEICKEYGNAIASMGIVLRSNDYLTDGLYFLINILEDNNYAVERVYDGNVTYLTPNNSWMTSDAINPDFSSWNTLRVDLSGEDMAFYINDVLVFEDSDNALDIGYVNLRVTALYDLSDRREFTKVWFRNLTITPGKKAAQ
jgi:hypothetical protein